MDSANLGATKAPRRTTGRPRAPKTRPATVGEQRTQQDANKARAERQRRRELRAQIVSFAEQYDILLLAPIRTNTSGLLYTEGFFTKGCTMDDIQNKLDMMILYSIQRVLGATNEAGDMFIRAYREDVRRIQHVCVPRKATQHPKQWLHVQRCGAMTLPKAELRSIRHMFGTPDSCIVAVFDYMAVSMCGMELARRSAKTRSAADTISSFIRITLCGFIDLMMDRSEVPRHPNNVQHSDHLLYPIARMNYNVAQMIDAVHRATSTAACPPEIGLAGDDDPPEPPSPPSLCSSADEHVGVGTAETDAGAKHKTLQARNAVSALIDRLHVQVPVVVDLIQLPISHNELVRSTMGGDALEWDTLVDMRHVLRLTARLLTCVTDTMNRGHPVCSSTWRQVRSVQQQQPMHMLLAQTLMFASVCNEQIHMRVVDAFVDLLIMDLGSLSDSIDQEAATSYYTDALCPGARVPHLPSAGDDATSRLWYGGFRVRFRLHIQHVVASYRRALFGPEDTATSELRNSGIFASCMETIQRFFSTHGVPASEKTTSSGGARPRPASSTSSDSELHKRRRVTDDGS